MAIAAVEYATRYAWPAIEEQQRSYGILRFAHGYTRRANSLALYDVPSSGYDDLVAECESFFASREQPAMIRVPHIPEMAELDSCLDARGYATEAPSLVMIHRLNDVKTGSNTVRRVDRKTWLDNYYALSGNSVSQRNLHEQLINRIKSETNYAVIESPQGDPTSCALAIHCDGVVGIHNVATSMAFRRQHWASYLVAALLEWGREVGASHAYLQVEKANKAAIKLYRKCGFIRLYYYSYRVKKVIDKLEREGSR